MVEIAGAPICDWQLRWLEASGITDVVVSVGDKADSTVRYLSRMQSCISMSFIYEKEPLGRGGGLRYAARSLPRPGESFVALDGDVITDLELASMWLRHERAKALATMAVVAPRKAWGEVHVDSDQDPHVLAFDESPVLPYWTNPGVYIMEWRVIDRLPARGDHTLTTLPELARERALVAHTFAGFCKAINTLEDVGEAAAHVRLRVARATESWVRPTPTRRKQGR